MALPQHERIDRSTGVLALCGDEWLPDDDRAAAPWEQAGKGAGEGGSLTRSAEDLGRRIDAAYDAWKEADAAAGSLLREMREAWRRHARGSGEPPSGELVGRAARLRQEASARLASAIQLLHEAGIIQPSPTPGRKRRLAGPLRLK